MELRDVRTAYEDLSAKASDIVRQLSLAAIGLIWLFKSGTPSAPGLDLPLLRAALFVFIALVLDFLQYVSGTTIWFFFFRREEKSGKTLGDEVLAPEKLTWLTWILFYLKAISMTTAYVLFIIPFLIHKFVA
jgi:hypothetical protein